MTGVRLSIAKPAAWIGTCIPLLWQLNKSGSTARKRTYSPWPHPPFSAIVFSWFMSNARVVPTTIRASARAKSAA